MIKLKDGQRAGPGETLIKNIPVPEKGQKLYYDSHTDAPKGFGIRILSSGTISFILRYEQDGRDRRLTIGQYPTWSLKAARDQAQEYRREVDGGTDIILDRKVNREAPTVADAIETFCSEHFDKLKSGKAARSRLKRYFISEVGDLKLKKVRRAEVRRIVREVAETKGREAALLLTNLKSFFAWAEDEEIIDSNPIATLKPAKVHANMKPRTRTRVLDDDEIRSFWEQVESCGIHKFTALAMKMILLTGARPGEVAGMKWSEIRGKIWTIPGSRRGKTETEHHVPLTDVGMTILRSAKAESKRLAKRRKVEPGDDVFEARPGQSLRADAISKAVARYINELGSKSNGDFGTWTAHDLRRTMRTGLAAAGVPVLVSELAIGHVKKGIIGVYDAHQYAKELRAAHEAWEKRLLRILAGLPADAPDEDDDQGDDNVLPFTREKLA